MAIWPISPASAQGVPPGNDVQINPGVLDALTRDLPENETSPKEKAGPATSQPLPKTVSLPQAFIQGEPVYSVPFRASKSHFPPALAEELKSWVSTMATNGKSVEIRAYADAAPGFAELGDLVRVSYHRAVALRNLILDAGLDTNRISILAMGPDTNKSGASNPDRADIYLLPHPLSKDVRTP